MVKVFKGLSEPLRLRIVMLLLDQELCVCDLMRVLQLPQPTISRHMALLKSAGLVLDRRDGKWVHYRLENTPLVNALKVFLRGYFFEESFHQKDRSLLDRYLSEKRTHPVIPRNGGME